MIEWLKTPQDETWGRWAGRALCSSRFPRKEATQWVDALGLRDDRGEIAVMGIGAGYHLFELLNRFPQKTVIALDGKESIFESWPLEIRQELANFQDRLQIVNGEDAVRAFVVSSKGIPVLRFRSACFAFEDVMFEDLLGQSPKAFGKRAWSCEYDFSKALKEIPQALAVNVKTLNADLLDPQSREAKLLKTLKELVR